MNTTQIRSSRFVVWLTLLATVLAPIQSARAQGTVAPAGITRDLFPIAPVQEGEKLVLRLDTNRNVVQWRWYKGTKRLYTNVQSDIAVTVNMRQVLIGYASQITIDAATKEDSGVYYVDLVGSDGSTTRSSMVQYTVTSKPDIVLQPKSQVLFNRESMTLRVDPKVTALATFKAPAGVAVDQGDENYTYVADSGNHMIRSVSPGGTVKLVAGTPGTLSDFKIDSSGQYYYQPRANIDGTAGSGARINQTTLAVVVPYVFPYIVQPYTNYNYALASPTPDTIPNPPLTPLANDFPIYVNRYTGMRYHEQPKIIVADNPDIYVSSAQGAAGSVQFHEGKGYLDSEPGKMDRAKFNKPNGIAVSPDGKLYVADTENSVIRMIDLRADEPMVTTVAGMAGVDAGFADGTVGTGAVVKTSVDAGGHAVVVSISRVGLEGRDGGNGYDSTPTVTVEPPPPMVLFDAGDPTELIAMPNDPNRRAATATAELAGYVSTVKVTNGGSGYVVAPTVKFSDPPAAALLAGGTAAQGIANIIGGAVVSIEIQNEGKGYATPPAISFSSGAAQATATIGKSVFKVTVTDGGQGYQTKRAPMMTIAGGTATRLNKPRGLKVDKYGNVLIADSNNHAIRMLRPIPVDSNNLKKGYTYALSTVAGSQEPGQANGTGLSARFYTPTDVAVDTSGGKYRVYVTDTNNHVIRKIEFPVDERGEVILPDTSSSNYDPTTTEISASVTVNTYAGVVGSAGFLNGPGLAANFDQPWGITVDTVSGNGIAYVTELGNNMIRTLTPSKSGECSVGTAAGNQSRIPGATDGIAAIAQFHAPHGIDMDSTGNIFVGDTERNSIRKLDSAGATVSTVAGISGIAGQTDTPSGGVNAEYFYRWSKDGFGLKSDKDPLADTVDGEDKDILKITSKNGKLKPANSGQYAVQISSGYAGNWNQLTESSPAKVTVRTPDFTPIVKSAKVGDASVPIDVLIDTKKIIAADTGARLGSPSFTFTMLSGADLPPWIVQAGEGSSTLLVTPPVDAGKQTIIIAMTVSDSVATKSGYLLLNIVPFDNGSAQKPIVTSQPSFRIVKDGTDAPAFTVEAQGINLKYQWYKDNVAIKGETSASLSRNAVKAADGGFYKVRITSDKGSTESESAQLVVVSTPEIGLNPSPLVLLRETQDTASSGTLSVSPVIHTRSLFKFPSGVAVDRASGELLVADQKNYAIRKIQPGGSVSGVAGSAGQLGDTDSSGVGVRFNSPTSIAPGAAGSYVIADTDNNKIRRLSSPDRVDTVYPGLTAPQGAVSDLRGNIYVADTGAHVLRILHMVDSIIGVNITEGGSGFTPDSIPEVRFSDYDVNGNPVIGTGAKAEAFIASGTLTSDKVIGVKILNPGSGYKNPPVVEFYDKLNNKLSNVAATALLSGVLGDNVEITSGGSKYKAAPNVRIVGGGVEAAKAVASVDPTTKQLTAITVTNQGSGYTSVPVVLIGEVAGAAGAAATATVVDGQVVAIKIDKAGTGYKTAPTITLVDGGVNVGTATASMGIGGIVPRTKDAVSRGKGYPKAPQIIISGGGGEGATATASISLDSAGIISSSGLTLSGNGLASAGSGYLAGPPSVLIFGTSNYNGATITPYLGTGKDFDKVVGVNISGGTGLTTITDADITVVNGTTGGSGFKLSSVSLREVGGGSYSLVPQVSPVGGGGQGMTAVADMAIHTLGFNANQDSGSGYTSTPKVTFNGGGSGNGAEVEAIMGISEMTVLNGGSGYLGAPTVTIAGSGGATAKARLGISGVNVTSPGLNYDRPPNVTFDWGTDAPKGVVLSGTVGAQVGTYEPATISATPVGGGLTFAVTNAGAGYKIAPVATLSGGDGSGASLTTSVDVNTGSVSIASSTPGTGYTIGGTVALTKPLFRDAIVTANLSTTTPGALAGFTIWDPGFGYKTTPTVELTSGGGSSAKVTATIDAATGAVTAVTLDPLNPGVNYTSAPTVYLTGPTRATAVMGLPVTAVGGTSILSVNAGTNQGFNAPPNVTIIGGALTTPNRPATGVAVMGVNTIDVSNLNPGRNYTLAPNIVFTDGLPADVTALTGTHATAVCKLGVSSKGVIMGTSTGSGGIYTTTLPTCTFSPPTSGVTATGTPDMGINAIIVGNSSGKNMGYTYPPTLDTKAISPGAGATLTAVMGVSGFQMVGTGSFTAMQVTSGGSYTSIPTVTFPAPTSNPGVTLATASEVGTIVGVGINSVSIISGGTYLANWVQSNPPDTKPSAYLKAGTAGFDNAAKTLVVPSFMGDSPTGIIPILGFAKGLASVTGAITFSAPGTGYTSAPNPRILQTGAIAPTAKAIMALEATPVSGGTFYAIPTVAALNGGTTPTVPAVLSVDITNLALKIPILNPGSGYTNGVYSKSMLPSGTISVTVSGQKISAITATGFSSYPTSIAGVNLTGTTSAFSTALLSACGLTTSGAAASIGCPYFTLNNNNVTVTNSGIGYDTGVLTFTSSTSAPMSGAFSLTSPYTSASATMKVVDIDIQSSGSGFTSVPSVNFQGGSGSGAVAIVNKFTMVGVTIPNTTVAVTGGGYTGVGPNPTGFAFITPTGGTAATGTVYHRITDVSMPWSATPDPIKTGNGYSSSGSMLFSAPSGGASGGAAVTFGLTINSVTVANPGNGFGVVTATELGQAAVSGKAALPLTSQASLQIKNLKVVGVNVTNPGGPYTSVPTISFSGATPAQASVLVGVTSVTLTSPGFGYVKRPTIKIDRAVGDTTGSGATGLTTKDLKVVAVNITDGGAGYTTRGSLSASFTNNSNSGSGVVNAGVVAVRPDYGLELKSISVTDPGNLYDGVPSRVNLSVPAGTPLPKVSATAEVGSLKVASIDITDKGSGYSVTPGVTIDAPTSGIQATAEIKSMKVVGLNLLNGGSGYSSVPTITISGGGGAGAKATVSSLTVRQIKVTNPGRNYTSPPSKFDIRRNNADLFLAPDAQIDVPTGLSVSSITVDNPGRGYTSLPTVTVVPEGGGSGADYVVSGLTVNSVIVGNKGGGYAVPPAIVFEPVETINETTNTVEKVGSGAIAQIRPREILGLANIGVVDGGSGYINVPEVVITGGGGSGAAATATVSGGKVTKIQIINAGSDYTSVPTVKVRGGRSGGTDAVLAATVCNAVYTIGTPGQVGYGDGDVGDRVKFSSPKGLALDKNGSLYVCDTANSVIRKVISPLIADKTGRRAYRVSTVAGLGGEQGIIDGQGVAARFKSPEGIVIVPEGISGVLPGTIYVTDTGSNTIRAITPAGVVSTIAGVPGTAGAADGPVSRALFNSPKGIDLDAAGNLYVADQSNHAIRKITRGAQSVVSTLAGVLGLEGIANSDVVSEYTYQWRLDGAPITGATGQTYSIPNKTGKVGSYDVVITNVAGSTASTPVQVRESSQTAVVTDLPAQVKVSEGKSVSLQVIVTAFPVPSFQWYRMVTGVWEEMVDGPDWVGTQTNTLTLRAPGTGPQGSSLGAQPGHTGKYKVKIGETLESRVAELKVIHKPILGNRIRSLSSFATNNGASYAVNDDGRLWTWGANGLGQLGNGGTDSRPLPVNTGADIWRIVSAGKKHAVGLNRAGAIFTWGDNSQAQLGTGGTQGVYDTVHQMGTEYRWLNVSAGGYHNLAIKADKYYGPKTSEAGWGAKDTDGVVQAKSIARDLAQSTVAAGAKWINGEGEPSDDLGEVGDYYVDTSAGGTLWGWGKNEWGQLGSDPSAYIYLPQQISLPSTVDATDLTGTKRIADSRDNLWVAVSAGRDFSVGILKGGTLVTWGRNDQGQLGDGTAVTRGDLATAMQGRSVVRVSAGNSHVLAVDSDGRLWSWGNNADQKLGQRNAVTGLPETNPSIVTPDLVYFENGATWMSVSAGANSSFGIDSNNLLWSWGSNGRGQLGLGTLEKQSYPTQVTPEYPYDKAQWANVAAGDDNVIATTLDGMVWSWGMNSVGQIGNGKRGDGIASILVPTDAGGSGYTTAPIVNITPATVTGKQGQGTGAKAKAILTGGVVTAIEVTAPGAGYIEPPLISFSGGGGSGATAIATLDEVYPDKIGKEGSIFVDNTGKPVAFHSVTKPANIRVGVLENGTNTGNVSYSWKLGDTRRITGPYTTKLSLTNPIPTGVYTLTVTNDVGSTTSPEITVLKVPNDSTTATGQFVDVVPVKGDTFGIEQIAAEGTDIVLKAPQMQKFTADPNAPYNNPTFEWTYYTNADDLVNSVFGDNVVGKTAASPKVITGSTLRIKAGALSNSGVYKVTATMKFGKVYSETAQSGLGEEITRTYTASKVLRVVQVPTVTLADTSVETSLRQGGDASATLSPIYLERGNSLTMGVSVANSSKATVFSILVPAGGTGTGYTTAPKVDLIPAVLDDGSDDTGTGATAVATVSGGRVVSVAVVNRGSGYRKAPTVVFREGGGVGATATAVLDAGVTYKWYKGTTESNGIAIPDTNSPQYGITTTTDTTSLDKVSGVYRVDVINSAGTNTLTDVSGNAGVWNVVLQWAPQIQVQPAKLSEVVAGTTLKLSVVASASSKPAPVTYQWYFNGDAIVDGDPRLGASGATTDNLTLTAVTKNNEGRYSVVVQNTVKGELKTATSGDDYGNVTIIDAVKLPAVATGGLKGGGSYVQGAQVKLELLKEKLTGQPLSFQWYRDKVMLLGENESSLILPSVQPSQAGAYTVRVFNSIGAVEVGASISVTKKTSGVSEGTITVESGELTRFFTQPAIPATKKLPVGTKIQLYAVAPVGKSLRGWTITNTPDGGSPKAVTLPASGAKFVLAPGATTITPKVGRSFAGVYSGLITSESPWDAEGGASAVNPSSIQGIVSAVTVAQTGALSGKAKIQGYDYTFTGTMDTTGTANFTITTRDGSKVKGTLKLDVSDGSEDGGMQVTIGTADKGVPISLPAIAAGGTLQSTKAVLYSIAAGSTGATISEPIHTAAVCRGDWNTLGRGGCMTIRSQNNIVVAFGYLGNGAAFTYSGTPVLRYPEGSGFGEDWDSLSAGSISDSAGGLATASMDELLTHQSTAVKVPIWTTGDGTTKPVTRPLVGGLVFSAQGVVGSIGLLDVQSPGTAAATPAYSANLIRGYPYQTTTTTAGVVLSSPFDVDQAPVSLYSSSSYPAVSVLNPAGLALDNMKLAITNFGSSIVHRVADSAKEPAASNITSTGNIGGITSLKWLGFNGTTSATPDSGLFNASFFEQNSDFQVSASRAGVPQVVFSGNSDTVTAKVWGVVLQADGGKVNAGGYGFMIRGTLSEKLTNTLGIGEVEYATNAINPSIRTYRTEAIQLLSK
ncbi:MAG: immunoglobulin domain-containing protein [Verrucomicrobiota bacterium]